MSFLVFHKSSVTGSYWEVEFENDTYEPIRIFLNGKDITKRMQNKGVDIIFYFFDRMYDLRFLSRNYADDFDLTGY